MVAKVKNYFSLVKFSHTVFAMPFALIGFFLGVYWAPLQEIKKLQKLFKNGVGAPRHYFSVSYDLSYLKLLLVVLAMIFARSAAMAFNRYLDKNFDALNPRTAIREIPSGIISGRSALLFVIFNSIAFIITCWFINIVCFRLSFIALFVVLFYSYTKRFTPLCHLVLGLGLSLAPIGAYLAVTANFALLPVLFSFTVLFWVSGFDIIYALQDEEFDKENNLYSIPAVVGKVKALHFSEFLHLLSLACVIAAGIVGHFSILYWCGVLVFGGMLIYQHTLVKPNDLRRVNLAFMTSNGIASVIFCIFVLLDLFINKNILLSGG